MTGIFRRLWVFALLGAAPSPAGAQGPPAGQPPEPLEFRVEVIASTPLPGVELLLEEIPAPVQTAVARDIEESGALDLSDFMNRRLNGVHVNENQGNPFQTDVNFRGYTASPLLGTPQGLSVYMDGVRINQPFGDVVSWDLIPRLAIRSITLMPGSNPMFGLNTLGGALSIHTKDGVSHPGTTLQALYGSHVRRAIEFEHGGSRASGLNWFVTGNLFGEDGWRDDSPSDVRQVFGTLGWKDTNTNLTLTTAYANNSLTGNGLQEQRLLDGDYASLYTKPDTTGNRSTFVNLTARRNVRRNLTASGNVYYRNIKTAMLNGDINDNSLDQSVYQLSAADRAALTAAGYSGFPLVSTPANTPFPSWRCIAQALQQDEPAEKCNGLLNTTESRQHNYGGAGQFMLLGSPGGVRSQLTVGAAYDGSRVGFLQSTQLGYLNPDHGVTGVDAFGDGVTGGDVDGEPFDTRVDLEGRINTVSVYASDTLAIGSAWHVTVSGRYNRTSVRNADRIQPGGAPGSLDGDHAFGRFNPAAGVTFSPTAAVNLYVGYSEGSRAATSIELGCADPEQPCKLPNAMAGDPPLEQVVTRTLEAGLRGGTAAASRTSWNVNVFRAGNRDDILFVSSPQTGFGYFKNFGNTRRLGLELAASSRIDRVALGAGYTFLSATYQSVETVDGSSNSANDEAAEGEKGFEGVIEILPGARIPLIPRHLFKAFADIRATSRLSLDIDLVAMSSALARGNENNQHEPDGLYYLGPGTSDGYGVLNLGARYQLHPRLQLLAQLNNLFNSRYNTAAQLGPAGFTSTGAFQARPLPPVDGEFPLQHSTFYAPGAPVTFWVGTRIAF